MEENFPFHLLSQDLQMYILSQDSKLLLTASYLSKSFHHRSLPYLYQQYHDQPLSDHTIFKYIMTYSPSKWYYVLYDKSEYKAHIIEYKSKREVYKENVRYTLYKSLNEYILQFSNLDNTIFLGKKQLIYAFSDNNQFHDHYHWIFDLITLSKVLTQRSFCLQRDSDYVRNYLLNYLSTLHQNAKTLIEKITFCMYLILNLIVYGQEQYLHNVSWSEEIEELIRVKYEKLVTYLQKN